MDNNIYYCYHCGNNKNINTGVDKYYKEETVRFKITFVLNGTEDSFIAEGDTIHAVRDYIELWFKARKLDINVLSIHSMRLD